MRDYSFVGLCLRLVLIANISVLLACSEAAEEAAKASTVGKGDLGERPTTSLVSDPDTDKFFSGSLTLNLVCEDPQNDCANTYYSTQDPYPDQSAGNRFSNNVTLPSNNSTTSLAYYSVDSAGNIEAIKSKTFVSDSEGPSSITIDPPGGTYSKAIHVKFTCLDGDGSGCAYIHYSINKAPFIRITMLIANQDGVLLNLDDTEIEYYGEDVVGNVSIVDSTTKQRYKFSNSIGDVVNPDITPSDGKITLTWDNAASSSYRGAIVRRSLTEFPADLNQGTELFKGDATVNRYVDLNVVNNTPYYYTIFAYDNAIPENSSLGRRLLATPIDNIPPASLTSFSAAGGDSQVSLNWEMPNTLEPDFAGIMIRRSISGYPSSAEGTEIYNGSGAELSTIDFAAINDTGYFYSLFTFDEIPNYSDPIGVFAATKDTLPPVSVTNFYAEARQGKVVLHWDLPLGHDIDRVVIRRDTATFPTDPAVATSIVDPTTGTSLALVSPLEDSTVTDTTTYYYTAFSYDISGNVTDGIESRSIATPMAEALVSVSPIESSIDVNPLTRIVSGTFTNALDTATIPNSLSVTSPLGVAVAGTVIDTGSTVQFQIDPSEIQLDLAAQYKATLFDSILDTGSARVLASDKSWTFTTADGRWGTQQIIVSDFTNSTNILGPIRAVVDDRGNILTVWERRIKEPLANSSTKRIYSNYFNIEGGFDPTLAKQISVGSNSINVVNGNVVKLAGSGNGNAVATWVQGSQIWAAAFVPGIGWKPPVRIQDFRSTGSEPNVAMNDKGDVVIVWKKQEGATKNVWANTFAFNNGDWSAITEGQLIEFIEDGAVNALRVQISSSGAAVAVWGQRINNKSSNVQLYFNHYDPITGWGSKTTPDPELYGHPYSSFGVAGKVNGIGYKGVFLLIDANDNLHAVWQVDSKELYANQYSFTSKAWSTPINVGISPITSSIRNISKPTATINKVGTVVVAWNQDKTTEKANNWLNRFLPDTGWGSYIPAPEGARAMHISLDKNGNVKLAARPDFTQNNLRVYSIPSSSDWIDVTTRDPANPEKNRERVNITNNFDIDAATIVSDHHGNATVLWRGKDNTLGAYVAANRFEFRLNAPDLVVTIDSVIPNTNGETINYTVTNNGVVDANPSNLSLWVNISASPVAGDVADIVIAIPALAVNASTTGLSANITTTLSQGTAYAAIDLENAIIELDETNNISTPYFWANVTAPIVFDFENSLLPTEFISSADANWGFESFTDPQAVVFNYLRSGVITDNQTSCVSVTALASSSITFDYKTSSEATDYLRFYIDDLPPTNAAWSGIATTALTPVTFTTTLGDHSYKWCYIKDGSLIDGLDAVWIDNINIQ